MTTETEMQEIERRLAECESRRRLKEGVYQYHGGDYRLSERDPHKAKEAIRYLEWRGLLERREDAPHVVRVKEE